MIYNIIISLYLKSWSEEEIGVNSSSYCDNDATSSKMYVGKGRVHFTSPWINTKIVYYMYVILSP